MFLSRLLHHWKVLLADRAYMVSLLVGVVVFFGSIFATQLAGRFKDSFNLPAVGDFILEHLPVLNLEFLFVWGFYFVVFLIVVYPLFFRPEKTPFALKTFGILLFVRVCFSLLTDIGPPDGFYFENIVLNNPLKDLTFRNDLFFSGHTAVPFLAFLIFKKTFFRWFMLASCVVLGLTVLFMHVHYSIDVFAAPFIAHGVYSFSDAVFNKLNLRFKKRLKQYKWKGLQRQMQDLKNKLINK